MSYFTTSNGSLISAGTLKKIAKRIKIGDTFDQINEEELVALIGQTNFESDDEAWEIFEHCEKLAQSF